MRRNLKGGNKAMEEQTGTSQASTEMPWLLFKIEDQVFAIDTRNVTSIFQITEKVTPVSDYPEEFRGIMVLRGEAIPMMELRKRLRLPTIQEEYESFSTMIDQRKQDHVHWVDELIRCMDNGDQFKLATDPHKCAFGQWYDRHQTDNLAVAFHMKKIDAPHQALHQTAVDAMKCSRQCDSCQRDTCLKTALDKASKEYMPQVVSLLDEAKEIYKGHFHEMCIVLSGEKGSMGLIVDDVLAVERLKMVGDGKELTGMYQSKLTPGVAYSQTVQGEILVMDEDVLMASVPSHT